jgi:hypothetical protein
MTAGGQTEVERLAGLIHRKLAAMECQTKPPSLGELNAARRLIDWLNRERELRRAKEITTRLPESG